MFYSIDFYGRLFIDLLTEEAARKAYINSREVGLFPLCHDSTDY